MYRLTSHLNKATKSSKYWVCGRCTKPKRLNAFHSHKACKACGYTGPAKLHFGPGSLRKSRNVRILKEEAEPLTKLYNMSFGEVSKELNFLREVERPTRWVTQVFTDGHYVGTLDHDICMFGDRELDEYMTTKRMMQIRIEPDLHLFLKEYAAKRETTMSAVVTDYVKYLKRQYERNIKVEDI